MKGKNPTSLTFLNEDRQIADMGKFAFLEISQLIIKGMFAIDNDHFSNFN